MSTDTETMPPEPARKGLLAIYRWIVDRLKGPYRRLLLEVSEVNWAMHPPVQNMELRERLKRLAANPPEGWQVMYNPTPEQMVARAAAIQTNILQRQAQAADLQNLVLDESREESRRITVLTKAIVILSVLVVLSGVGNVVALVALRP